MPVFVVPGGYWYQRIGDTSIYDMKDVCITITLM